jgi:hypothetical protein
MLDRGEQLDWFGSLEIRIEALVCVIAFAYFVPARSSAWRCSRTAISSPGRSSS